MKIKIKTYGSGLPKIHEIIVPHPVLRFYRHGVALEGISPTGEDVEVVLTQIEAENILDDLMREMR